MTCLMRTMRQPAFSRRMAILLPAPFPFISAGALPVTPAGAPLCHTRPAPPSHPAGPSVIPGRPLRHTRPAPLCHTRRPPPVIPAVFSGNPVKTVFPQGSIRESYSFDREHDLRVVVGRPMKKKSGKEKLWIPDYERRE